MDDGIEGGVPCFRFLSEGMKAAIERAELGLACSSSAGAKPGELVAVVTVIVDEAATGVEETAVGVEETPEDCGEDEDGIDV